MSINFGFILHHNTHVQGAEIRRNIAASRVAANKHTQNMTELTRIRNLVDYDLGLILDALKGKV